MSAEGVGITETQVEILNKLVNIHGMKDNVSWMSSDKAHLKKILTLNPKARIGLIPTNFIDMSTKKMSDEVDATLRELKPTGSNTDLFVWAPTSVIIAYYDPITKGAIRSMLKALTNMEVELIYGKNATADNIKRLPTYVSGTATTLPYASRYLFDVDVQNTTTIWD